MGASCAYALLSFSQVLLSMERFFFGYLLPLCPFQVSSSVQFSQMVYKPPRSTGCVVHNEPPRSSGCVVHCVVHEVSVEAGFHFPLVASGVVHCCCPKFPTSRPLHFCAVSLLSMHIFARIIIQASTVACAHNL